MTQEEFAKKKNRYGYLASLPIVLAIVHFIGAILFQSTVQVEEGVYSSLFSLSLMFSSSVFVGELGSLNSWGLSQTLSSITSIVVGIAFVILSSLAIKGKNKAVLSSLVLYAADVLFLVPSGLLSLLEITPLRMDLATFLVNLLVHLLLLCLLVYAWVLSLSLAKESADN